MTWIIKKVNRIPTHCGVAYESVHSHSRGHVIRVCQDPYVLVLPQKHYTVERMSRWIYTTTSTRHTVFLQNYIIFTDPEHVLNLICMKYYEIGINL